MGFCPRCKSETPWRSRCTNCGTLYCNLCSTLSDQNIYQEGKKPHSNLCTDQCPSCRKIGAGQKIEG